MQLCPMSSVLSIVSVWVISASAAPSSDRTDDGDVTTEKSVFHELSEELTALEKEILEGKRIFHQVLHRLHVDLNLNDPPPGAVGLPLQFNLTLHSLQSETRRLRMSLSSSMGSLNDFADCVNSCCLARHNENTPPEAEGAIHYFCQHNCMLVFEHSHGHPGNSGAHGHGNDDDDDDDDDVTSTPGSGTDPLAG